MNQSKILTPEGTTFFIYLGIGSIIFVIVATILSVINDYAKSNEEER